MNASPKSRRRVLIGVSAVALLSLGVGVAAGSRITSPADAAAKTAPPKASQITVPVEKRALSTKVMGRGDASFDGAVSVTVETSGLQTPAVVTGRVPVVGSAIQEGKALLEITGRPVIGLAGVLPMYRALSPGSRGPDVLQLEQTLRRLNLRPGKVDGVYDGDTASAVERMYKAAGYQAPEPDQQLKEAADAAKKAVDSARGALREAKRALKQARATPPAAGQTRDVSVEQGAVDDATKALQAAEKASSDATAKAGTRLPQSEVVYVKSLPRRVDEVKVARGSVINGPVMSVSGAAIVVTIDVDAQNREPLKVGMPASLDLGQGSPIAAKILRISGAGDSYKVVLAPKSLTARQLGLLRGANVRVTIPVKSTDGKVVVVPVAALSAGPDGSSRVEVQRDGKTTLVQVTIGLSADGFAQVTPNGDAKLDEGDQVVVGR